MAKTRVPDELDAIAPGTEHSTFLFFTEGSSDKQYQLHIRAKGELWVCDYANGRRGSSLTTGTKTTTPVEWAEAYKIYASEVRRQTRRGYTREQSGAIYTASEVAGRVSGERPQLPTAITRERSLELIEDPAWGLQRKADGQNRILIVEGDSLKGANRLGLYVDIPVAWKSPASEGRTVFCGEHVGDRFYAFDLLDFMGQDLRSLPYEERFHRLNQVSRSAPTMLGWMEVLELAITVGEKSLLSQVIEAEKGEGWVFKRLDAPFGAGRSDDCLKLRLWESATCLVTRKNAQRSVGVALHDEAGNPVDLGNVTIPANAPVPEVGSLLEVRYLNRHHEGKFEMPTYIGPRTDMVAGEDTKLSQVKRIKHRSAVDTTNDDEPEAEAERPRG